MTSSQKRQDVFLTELLRGRTWPKDLLGEHGLLQQLSMRMVERALSAELAENLGYKLTPLKAEERQ